VAWDNPADSPASAADSLEEARNPAAAAAWLPDGLEAVAAAKGWRDCPAATDSWLEKGCFQPDYMKADASYKMNLIRSSIPKRRVRDR
jgi:hypothetical protein